MYIENHWIIPEVYDTYEELIKAGKNRIKSLKSSITRAKEHRVLGETRQQTLAKIAEQEIEIANITTQVANWEQQLQISYN